ncbi:MAG: hypothetical protein A2233_03490 [Candidatus Kerfeldbacteria bacterium RIFOXYA2_FULL_38_24]|uniref:Uncharacterized protein n=1 Tax=Candidatus Kerfeldbacteria bacterium RIFOXYB2_FULL_38_14 TaxID=1798547 RepID=A0A1G2BH19_9BACT|nr:MAG: hypothetical protein A2233_03490 [Candidatus Kerfeldbacteria bacterium RIFOXYA2_FULL_38_24]OGY87497.1 MAG: hypothetical protein A2319_03985 [Candidatus Kerfeldbacteria bacterium RIFOXYB2_FULL_38_14]OGY90233.1 MAG: hypothetical protein A2458_03680 [Candidatus Kerfeldbacteria bacterium RIFOXYC2_FULL_38_9]
MLIALPTFGTEIYNHDLVNNGNFENELDDWSCSNCNEDTNIIYDDYYSTHYLLLGGLNAYQEAKQAITITPDAGKVTLSFDCDFITTDNINTDYFTFTLQDEATNESYIKDTIYPSDETEYCQQDYTITQYAGKTLEVIFGVNNDANKLTTAKIDNVVMTEKSYSKLTGRVLDDNYNKIKKAKVTIKKDNGTILWTGKTNKKGLFIATHLATNYTRLRIIVKKGNLKKTFHTYVEWGTNYNKVYRFK